MSYLDWKVGDQVVCVDTWARENDGNGYGDEVGPIAGQIYTIREIGFLHPTIHRLQVRLFEIENVVHRYNDIGMWEQTFYASRFRPVQKRSTDISLFRALLNPTPEQAEQFIKADHDEQHQVDAEVLRAFILANRDGSYP
ncbi:hypothetical protein LRP31_25620 [Mesorhizobium mediterraneum]|uniref:Uncharacterized protein n=1 Tax=Mesorhizobium mediterraneum TaxID=43617 RepID=A0AB36RIC9_9HYPH|nr:hypothetical protein [Mesorhizobium mediterraneum]PAQ03699.1 hypothetical protein CIT25_04065 [Mesorhizobium mediterraneum]WIW52402.1 hypothetical protein LRP31_25620 [Mesorhizobium mediterraneum]